MKILQNIGGQEMEILTEMSPAGKKLNQYSRFDQWNLAYDQNGNLSNRGGQGFTYDYRNRMVRATESGSTLSFNYDALGRRTEKTGPQGITRYYYAGNQVIEERDGAGQLKKQYVYGNGIDEVLRLDLYSGNTPTPYYFHTNQIGSTTAITDADGNIVERVSYDTYGKPKFVDAEGLPLSFSLIGNTTLFQGREYDPETGLYHFRARTYDPIMGRFLQVDPLGYVDSMNLYQAFNLNPVNYVDPLGEFVLKLRNALLEAPNMDSNWKFNLRFSFNFEFDSELSYIKKYLQKETLSILTDLVADSIISWNPVSYVLTAKGWIDRLGRFSDFTDKENIMKVAADPLLERVYRERFGDKTELEGAEVIEFLDMAKQTLMEYWPDVAALYDWDGMVVDSIGEWEKSIEFKQIWMKKRRIIPGPIERFYDGIKSFYREHYLKPNQIDEHHEPSYYELYRYLLREWEKKLMK